jgi:hypothetical protein
MCRLRSLRRCVTLIVFRTLADRRIHRAARRRSHAVREDLVKASHQCAIDRGGERGGNGVPPTSSSSAASAASAGSPASTQGRHHGVAVATPTSIASTGNQGVIIRSSRVHIAHVARSV